jgi:hypothetical protein
MLKYNGRNLNLQIVTDIPLKVKSITVALLGFIFPSHRNWINNFFLWFGVFLVISRETHAWLSFLEHKQWDQVEKSILLSTCQRNLDTLRYLCNTLASVGTSSKILLNVSSTKLLRSFFYQRIFIMIPISTGGWGCGGPWKDDTRTATTTPDPHRYTQKYFNHPQHSSWTGTAFFSLIDDVTWTKNTFRGRENRCVTAW